MRWKQKFNWNQKKFYNNQKINKIKCWKNIKKNNSQISKTTIKKKYFGKLNHSVHEVESLVHGHKVDKDHENEKESGTVFDIVEEIEDPSEFPELLQWVFVFEQREPDDLAEAFLSAEGVYFFAEVDVSFEVGSAEWVVCGEAEFFLFYF